MLIALLIVGTIVAVMLTTAYVVTGFAILDAFDITATDHVLMSLLIIVCWPIIALYLILTSTIRSIL